MASFSEGKDLMNSQNVGTTRLPGDAAPVPKCVYFSISPSTSRFHRVMLLASRYKVSWQEIIRIAIDSYLTKFPQEKI